MQEATGFISHEYVWLVRLIASFLFHFENPVVACYSKFTPPWFKNQLQENITLISGALWEWNPEDEQQANKNVNLVISLADSLVKYQASGL